MKEITKLSEIPPGPNISGTVQVPLAELDKLRVDHATTKKLCETLINNQKRVLIVLEEEFRSFTTVEDITFTGSKARRLVDSKDRREITREYKNLDDVIDVIKQELVEKAIDLSSTLKDEINTLNKVIAENKTTISTITKEQKEQSTTIQNLKAEIEVKDNNIEKLTTDCTTTADQLNEYKLKQTELLNQIDKLKSELKVEKEKKGFWGFLFKI